MKLNIARSISGSSALRISAADQALSTRFSVLQHCYVDLAVLESTYAGHFASNGIQIPKHDLAKISASSALSPAPPVGCSSTERSSGIIDLGIWTYNSILKLSWGRLLEYLSKARQGLSTQEPWQPNSAYHFLMVEIYEFELACSDNHRLKALDPEARSFEDLQQHSTYWTLWFTMQVILHTYQALLHHPLLLLHHRNAGARSNLPPSFMQHNIDQAVLHAGWVCKMLDMWTNTGLRISDPLIGYLVGATATIHFLLGFAKDESVTSKASDNFGRCCDLLSKMSLEWSHLKHTVCLNLFKMNF
jgi:hypothetical protein